MSQVSIDWGDGHVEEKTVTEDDGAWTLADAKHTYDGPGRFRVSVAGLNGGVGGETVVITMPGVHLVLTVNAPATQVKAVYTEYTTRLQNQSPGSLAEATGTYTFSREDNADLYAGEIYLETGDTGGVKTEVPLTLSADKKKLTGSETYPIPGNLDAISDVGITINEAGVFKGRSQIKDGDAVLTTTDYTFTVTAA